MYEIAKSKKEFKKKKDFFFQILVDFQRLLEQVYFENIYQQILHLLETRNIK